MPQNAPGPNSKGGVAAYTTKGHVESVAGGGGAQGPEGPQGPPGPTGPQGPIGPGIADAPNDGAMYVRQNGAWVQLP